VFANRLNWVGVVSFALTGVVASLLAARLKRAGRRLSDAHRKTRSILESISDGFTTFDREWKYTYVNPAAARMIGKTPEELLSKSVWDLWPHAKNSPFEVAFRRAATGNIPVQTEAFYPEPLNAWFDVRCYPSPDGLALFFTNTTEQKRRQEQLRLLESAILQTGDGIVIVKLSGEASCCQEPVFVNAAFERITGFSLEDLRGGALPLLHSPSWSAPTSAAQPPRSRSGCISAIEQPVRRKDGTEFWAEFALQPLQDGSGSYTHCVWTIQDTTERKKAEEMSRLFGSIVENSDDAILSKTMDGIVVSWNKGAERIYGYTQAEMVGKPISALIPSDRTYEQLDILDDLRRGRRLEHLETDRIRKDGRRIHVSLTMSPIHNSEGYIVGASVIARDITDRIVAGKALARSEEKYRSLALASSQIVWTTNAQGEVTDDIPHWRDFTGQGPDEIDGSGWLSALHPEDRDRTTDIWARAVKCRSFFNTEYRLRRYDDEYRWMDVHGVPVLEADGIVREWVGTCTDIHDRKQAEEEIRKLNQQLERRVGERTAALESANHELEAFAYSVSHDLRAPLRAVDGFSRILLDEFAPQLPEEAKRYLSMARKNAVQMGQLIDDLLAFSRLGRQPLSKQTISPAEIVRQVLEELREERDGRRVEITLSDLPQCQGDPNLLKQVYANLLSNGLKYTRKQEIARIEIGCLPSDSGDGLVYYVRDNGVGFDMRYANKLFGVFQRLHGSQEYPGTGVGLAIVQRIIHRHGGSVWAEAAVNQGATFYFALSPRRAPLEKGEITTCTTNS